MADIQGVLTPKNTVHNAPIIVLPEGGNPGRTSGNPGECKIYTEQSLTFSRDPGKCGKLNSPGPWGMPIDDFLWIISCILCPKARLHACGADLNFSSKV